MTRPRRIGCYVAAILAIAILTLLSAVPQAEDLGSWNKTALTSVAGMTNLDAPRDADDPGVGGGIDTASYFRTRLLPQLADCTDRIEAPIIAWVKHHAMTVRKSERVPGNLLIHATKDALMGLFEFTYRVDGKRERARATLYFYSADGARHEPLGIEEMLKSYGIAELQDELDAALQCGTA